MSTLLEVEDKYEIPVGFELPEFGDLPGVASIDQREPDQLEALYFDTPDLRLARSKVTLRRRTGGVDPGWHLKLPAGSDRLEVHRPLGRGQQVPLELRRLVFGRTRGMSLSPVVQLKTTRTTKEIHDEHGQLMASVMDDEVHGTVLGEPGSPAELSAWREVEVELGTADRDLLKRIGRQLRDVGAQRSRRPSKLVTVLGDRLETLPAALPAFKKATPNRAAGDVVRGYLTEQLDRLLACDTGVRLDQDGSIHDMRVATRRMRSTLSTFGRVLDAPGAADLEQRLGELAAALGVVRDAEVLLERFDARLDGLPPELVLGPIRDRLHQSLESDRLQGRTALLATLSGPTYGRLLDDLNDLIASEPSPQGPGSRPAKEILPKLVARRFRKLARRASRATTATGSERALALHQTRKSAKQLRYAAEAVEQAFGRPAAALAAQAEAIQEILGEHQDSVVASDRLKMLAITANTSEGESAFTYGILVGLEQDAGKAARQEFDLAWKDASRKRYRRWLS